MKLIKKMKLVNDFYFKPKQHNINVLFTKANTTGDLLEHLSLSDNRNVILWYIGCYGLKKSCVDFYRSKIIHPFLKQNQLIKFWLVDLTAWFGVNDSRGSITKDSVISCQIESMKSQYFEVIRSSSIFEKMINFSCDLIVKNFVNSMNSILELVSSKRNLKAGVSVESVFPGNSHLFRHFKTQDLGMLYSSLQYVEGFFIIQLILEKLSNFNKEIFSKKTYIQFLLPEDEYKYYLNENVCFEKDLQLMVCYVCEILKIKSITLVVEFLSFPYDRNRSKRPYNGIKGDKTLKSIDLISLSGKFNNRVNNRN